MLRPALSCTEKSNVHSFQITWPPIADDVNAVATMTARTTERLWIRSIALISFRASRGRSCCNDFSVGEIDGSEIMGVILGLFRERHVEQTMMRGAGIGRQDPVSSQTSRALADSGILMSKVDRERDLLGTFRRIVSRFSLHALDSQATHQHFYR